MRSGMALACRDYWRVDFRLDEEGRPFVLEVNTLPGLQPGYSDMPKMTEPLGLGYNWLIASIVESAVLRRNAGNGRR